MSSALGAFVFHNQNKKVTGWPWVTNHWSWLFGLARTHIYIVAVAMLFGVVVSLALGVWAYKKPNIYPSELVITTIIYTVPSLAFIVFLVEPVGLDNWTVIIPLAVYALAILVRAVVEGLRSVPEEVNLSAVAMGYKPLRRLLSVELPIALPVIVSGLRITFVASMSMATMGSLVGISTLGTPIIDGFGHNDNYAEILAGIVGVVILAGLCDLLLQIFGRVASPWAKGRGR